MIHRRVIIYKAREKLAYEKSIRKSANMSLEQLLANRSCYLYDCYPNPTTTHYNNMGGSPEVSDKFEQGNEAKEQKRMFNVDTNYTNRKTSANGGAAPTTQGKTP